jgi:hypothetical protein
MHQLGHQSALPLMIKAVGRFRGLLIIVALYGQLDQAIN